MGRLNKLLGISVLVLVAGCGGSSKPIVVNPSGAPASMPTPPAPGPSNTYLGTDSVETWSLSLDDTKNTFTYSESGSTNAPVSGAFQNSNGFLNLGQPNGASLGYALEVQGRLALLRPGDSTAPLIVSVPQTTCYSIPYRLRFTYVPMEAASGSSTTFTTSNYASVVINTDASGANWQFQGLEGSPVSGPASFTATCATANGQTPLSITGQSLFNTDNNNSSLPPYKPGSTDVIATSLAIGPSGIFVSYQTDKSDTSPNSAGTAGVAEPTTPLGTSNVAAGTYLGFLTIPPVFNGNGGVISPQNTSPVSFGQTPSSGTTMTGGTFPNDDVTQTPTADISITLGSQSSTINGLYPSAKVTMLDPNQNCFGLAGTTPGTNALGYPTCTFPAVAVVGNPEGKYVIFLDTFNWTVNSVASGFLGAPMQIYLYQQ